MIKELKMYELKKAPETCCPEPSCDLIKHIVFNYDKCESYGKNCQTCIHK